jgi:hypothetical protein
MMNIKTRFIIASLLICAMLSACAPPEDVLNATATQIASNRWGTLTAIAPTRTPTSTPSPTVTITPTASPSPTSTPNQTSTAFAARAEALKATLQAQQDASIAAETAIAEQTQQAVDALWAQLAGDGSITGENGELTSMKDFEQSWAQRNWYQWWPFGVELSNFVLTSHLEWKTTPEDKTAEGACGFVFRIQEKGHLVVFLYTTQRVELGVVDLGRYQLVKRPWVNPVLEKTAPKDGSANFLLAADGESITVYIDGVKSYRWVVARTDKGDLGYTLLSGTNRDFGTYCKFSNTRLWELKK